MAFLDRPFSISLGNAHVDDSMQENTFGFLRALPLIGLFLAPNSGSFLCVNF